MVEVYPKKKVANLKKSARNTADGKGLAPLPGVKTDAKAAAEANPKDPNSPYYGNSHFDPKGFESNRKLAERINAAVNDLKTSDEDGARFVLAWRMYPNADHPAWNQKDVHYCGCGCGCYAPGPQKPTGKAKSTKTKAKSGSSKGARKK
jgi:hypothetical protein